MGGLIREISRGFMFALALLGVAAAFAAAMR